MATARPIPRSASSGVVLGGAFTEAPPLEIPFRPWGEVRERISEYWIINDAPHWALLGQTRSGKSTMIRKGLLPLCLNDNVLVIDGKGGKDAVWRGWGHVVNEYPSRASRKFRDFWDDGKPHWFRLVASMDRAKAQDQVGNALRRALSDGGWIIVTDEMRYVVDAKDPNLGLSGLWEAIMMRGGSAGVGAINGSQEPVWLPSTFYTQPSFFMMGRMEDERAHKRVAEIGATRELFRYLPRVRRHHWIYTDPMEEERYWALTTLPL